MEVIHAFTDGTGVDPTETLVRLVAWAWVVATEAGTLNFPVMAHGGVPGQWQTVLRAEICAAISAVKYASQVQKPLRILLG